MAKDVADLLATWRELERLLEGMPQDDPRSPSVRAHVDELRLLYGEVADITATYEAVLDRARSAVARSRAVLD